MPTPPRKRPGRGESAPATPAPPRPRKPALTLPEPADGAVLAAPPALRKRVPKLDRAARVLGLEQPGGERKVRILMDSGAYSAWRLNKHISVEDYCDFLHENMAWIDHYVGLDVINPKDPEAAASEGFKNLRYMRKRGLNPVHVYHPGENIDWLHRMLDEGCDYIGLAALSLGSHSKAVDWYSAAWDHLVDGKGRALVKVHAFGDGRYDSLKRFPWRSADSASWLYAAQRTGGFTIGEGEEAFNLSHRKDGANPRSAPELTSLPPADAARFAALLAQEGVDPAGFAERGEQSYALRTYLTLRHYDRMRSRLRAGQPFLHHPSGFLRPELRAGEGLNMPPMDFFLVMGGNTIAQSAIAYAGYDSALVSYYYMLNLSHYQILPRFTADPVGFCSTIDPFKRHWDILARFVKKEKN
jgi:hypothetical protein